MHKHILPLILISLFILGCSGQQPPTASLFDSSKIDLSGKPFAGGEDAKVTIIEYSDFQCPFCASSATTLQKIKQAYGDRVKIYFKHFPLDKNYNPLMPYQLHPLAGRAAVASEAAAEQGKFWEYHDALFANQGNFDDASLIQYAGQLGLDAEQFQRDLNDPKTAARVTKDIEEGNELGIDGTPTIIINNKKFVGASYNDLTQLIDEELAQKQSQ